MCNLSIRGDYAEDCREFEDFLGYTVHSRPARAIVHEPSQNNDNNEFEANQSYIMRIFLE